MHENPWNYMEPVERKRLIALTDSLFGENVREARRALGWSQRHLSEEVSRLTDVDIDPSAMTRIEAGDRRVSLRQALAITIALDESVIDELVWVENKGPVDLGEWVEMLEQKAAENAERVARLTSELTIARETDAGLAEQLENVRALRDAERDGETVQIYWGGKSKAERLAERDG